MDPLSHAVTGTVVAQSAARRQEVVAAGIVGALAGSFPDIDVLFRSATDPLLQIEYHRQFTHALVMVPVFALLVGAVLYPLVRPWLTFGRTYLFSFLALLHHGMLDSMTSYGTHLFWPFTDRRETWSIVSVIDPLYTVPLLILVAVAFRYRRPGSARAGLVYAACFLSFGALQASRALEVGRELAAERGDAVERIVAKPALFNNVLFRLIYASEGRFHVDAVRVNWWGDVTVYEGGSVERVELDEALAGIPEDSPQYRDVRRFAFFSDGFLYFPDGLDRAFGDLRYSMLVNELHPIWAIQLKPDQPEEHVDLKVYRDHGPEERRQFARMIFGRPIDGSGGDGH